MNKNIVFLVSGGGGNLKFLQEIGKLINFNYEIVGVISDRFCPAIDYANQQGIKNYTLNYNRKDSSEFDEKLKSFNADIVITNIHKILSVSTLNSAKCFINLHYSLLPEYAGEIGMKTIDLAKKDNKTEIGATCHFVNEILDGGVIIRQEKFAPNWNDDLESVYDKMFRIGAICLLTSILTIIEEDFGVVNVIENESFWLRIKSL